MNPTRWTALALAALALLLPGVSSAAQPPAPEALAVLGARCDSAGLVRVVTHRSARIVHRLRLDPDGVALLGPGRAAFIELGTPPEKRPTLVPWSDVEGLALGRSRTAKGFLGGALVGSIVGGAIVATYGTDLAEDGDHALLAFGVLVGLGCTALGTMLGAGNPEWTPLYP